MGLIYRKTLYPFLTTTLRCCFQALQAGWRGAVRALPAVRGGGVRAAAGGRHPVPSARLRHGHGARRGRGRPALQARRLPEQRLQVRLLQGVPPGEPNKKVYLGLIFG